VIGGPVSGGVLVGGTILALDTADIARRLPGMTRAWVVIAGHFAHLGAPLLRSVSPDVVAFPLFGPGYDALQVVERLGQLGYRGRMCCLTGPLPAPDMVRRELEAVSRGAPLWMVERPD
jgi:hypothetical protein